MNAWFASMTDQSLGKKNGRITLGHNDKFIFYTGEGSQYFSSETLSMEEFHKCISYLLVSHPACQNKSIKEKNFFGWIEYVGASLELLNDHENC